jgi:hypothetical protein
MVKQIIKEAMNQNPLGLKEAVESELRKRITVALDSKMNESVELEEGAKWELNPANYMVGSDLSYDDKLEYTLNKKDSDILNSFLSKASDTEKSKLWKMFWDSKERGNNTAQGPVNAIKYAKAALNESVELEETDEIMEAAYMSVANHLISEGIDVSDLSESQLNELIGAALKMIGRGLKKTVVNKQGNLRFSTAGKADSAEAKSKDMEKARKDRERLQKARERIQKEKQLELVRKQKERAAEQKRREQQQS